MSDRKPGADTITFEPVSSDGPDEWWLACGVLFPGVVMLLELMSGLCASYLFDPMPTWGHVVAVASVPAINLLVWLHLDRRAERHARLVAAASGVSMAIAAFYALLFLPLMPIAVIAIIIVVGVLALAPLASFVAAIVLARALAKRSSQPVIRPMLGGIVAGVLALVAVDIGPDATRTGAVLAASGQPTDQARGLWLLRHFGDQDLLLRMCYGLGGRPVGLLSTAQALRDGLWYRRPRQDSITPAAAREIYYRAYGVPFNTRPMPARASDHVRSVTDRDLGGTQVGGRVEGLDLISSQMDGSVSGDDAVAYLEWVFTFRNTSPLAQEARLQLALPPGGVVSRATLWVNGEEREAAYGGKAEVRAAYQQVAVRQRQDPLLVTTNGADRVLAQAFPVPANGGTIQFKIGITAPLALGEPGKASLVLPAVVDRNFSFGADARHSVWIEGKEALATGVAGLAAERTGSGAYRLVGALDDRALMGARPRIDVARNAAAGLRVARLGDGAPVAQEIVQAAPAGGTVMLVIDGSAKLAASRAALIKALDAIPLQVKVGAVLAAEDVRRVAPGPWTSAQKLAITDLIRSADFMGGQDNAPALVAALQALETEPNATLLWVHGPQPVRFAQSQSQLEQAGARLTRFPQLLLYEVEAGPNELLSHGAWPHRARSLPRDAGAAADLSAFLAGHWSEVLRPVVRRRAAEAADGNAEGSQHIARLWAHERVLDLAQPASRSRDAAVALATQYRLVTPVSGAVVLETQRQYDQNGLQPVTKATVPTVPEPHEWALILIVGAMLLRLAWQNRQRVVAA